jgi:hypothetical protein
MRRVVTIGSLALAFALLTPAAYASTYGLASIVSVAPDAQFDEADSPVMAADGGYIAFRGTVDGETGIWRSDLLTGTVAPVAVNLPGALSIVDPQAPSISANGRYIAFDTRSQLDPVNDTNNAWDVYVRDMTVAATAPGAYTLASAVNNGTQALSYGVTNPNTDGSRLAGVQSNPTFPSTPASPGGAITADGQEVIFSVDTPSDLATTSQITTPGGQVAMRNLANDTTTIVSTTPAGAPVSWSGGAVDDSDAVISGDGSAVAWISPLGAIEQEAATLPGEDTLPATRTSDDQAVWRQIGAGLSTPSLRVTGGVDPLNPACLPGSTVTNFQIPAGCAGPLDIRGVRSAFSHLEMSSDGYSVVLLSPAALVGSQNNSLDEAYSVNMHPGLTRDQATRALTQAVQFSGGSPPGEANIAADAISADGSTVVLSTARTRFDLMSPTFVGPSRPTAALGNELYVVNLPQDTLDLVTEGYDTSFADYPNSCVNSTESPSLDSDGGLAAFDSCADNLVWGDGNGASDVFVSSRLASPSSSNPGQSAGSLPPVTLRPEWLLRITSQELRDGAVRLAVIVPSAGRLSARATIRYPVGRSRRGHRRRTVLRTIASSHTVARRGGRVFLRLSLRRGYVGLARRRGVRARVQLAFKSPHVITHLQRSISASFRIDESRTGHRRSHR